jgi:hypothetical protein
MRIIFSQISRIRDRVALASVLLLWGAVAAQAAEAVVYTPWDGEYGAYVIADDQSQVRVVAELVATEMGGQPAGVLALAFRRVPPQPRRIALVLNGEPWFEVELAATVSDFGVVLPRLNVLRDIGITLRVGQQEGLVRTLTIAEGAGARFPERNSVSRQNSLQVRPGSEQQRWLTFRCGPATKGAALKSVGLDADGEQPRLLSLRMLAPSRSLIGDVGVTGADAGGYQLNCEDTAGQRRPVTANGSE